MKTDLIINMKERKEQLNEIYQKLLEVGFGNGPIEESLEFMDVNVMGYGTALDEKIMSYDEFRELIFAQRKQAANFDEFIYESNPVINRLFNEGNSALIVDEIDLISVIDGENNKMTVRMSTMLEFNNETWKVVHWHGSIADHVSDGEDPWHVEEWKQKTEKLERMVEEKTAELIRKNSELEIEAGLERVRSIAMGMQKSDDLLLICEVSYHEFEKLGFDNLRAVLIHILDDEKRTFADYDYCGSFGGQISTLSYDSHPVVVNYFNQIRSSKDAFAEAVFSGKELERWKKVRLETGQKDDPRLYTADALYYYGYSIGIGDFSISTLKPIDEAQINILKRFRNVFDLAYRRYTDIAQAEKQAREAKVEAALERVRSLALSMRKSQEVGNVTDRLFNELINLNVDVNGGSVVVIDEESDKMELWRARSDIAVKPFESTSFSESMNLLKKYMPDWFPKFFDALRKRKSYLIDQLTGDKRSQFINVIAEQYKYSGEELTQLLKNTPEKITTYYIFFKLGYLALLGKSKLSEENLLIARRFVEVFEFSYTRFLDIKNAEAQTREAQIEAALEKVRSRTMAMQHSDELPEVANVLFLQVQSLGIPTWSAGYNILSKDKRSCTCIMSSEGQIQAPFHLPFDGERSFQDWYAAIERGDRFFVQELGGKQLESHYEYLFSLPDIKEAVESLDKAGIPFPTYQVNHLSFFKQGFLLFITYAEVPDSHGIFKRFTIVFEQTYARFLDLQKAEAQTREAQIELSLERIRAQVTAMQESSELLDIVVTMRREFVALGHEAHYFWYMRWLPDKYEKAMTSGDGTRIGMVMELPRHIHGDIKLIADWEKSDDPTVVYTMDVEAALDYVVKMINLGDFKQVDPNAPSEDDIRHINGLTFIMARTTHGEIGFSLPGVVSDPSSEALSTLERFAGVFDMAYRRFEDLKNAEAKAREAQIEAALERVRAKSMAMHKSDELADLSLELVKQVHALGVDTWFCAFNIYDDDQQGSLEWGSNGQGTFPQYRTPREGIFLRYYEAGQRGEKLFVNEISEKECPAHYDYLCSLPGVGEQLLKMKEAGIPFPTSQIDHVAYFKYGYIIFITFEPALEAHDIFKRFAGVFEQTYTRFLDLQQSEEQRKIIQAENDRKTEELEEARQLQLAMLPKELPKLAKLDISVYMQTATEVGGDYYDFSTKDDGSLNVCLGDATGHGLKAGTLVSMMKSLFIADSVKLDIKKFFTSSNDTLKKMSLSQMMMAFAMINIYGQKIKIANAGIPPIYIYRKSKNEVEEVTVNGLPIGAMKHTKYEVYEVNIESGDVLLMLSDGMPELQNKENEMYGYDRLKKVFKENAEKDSNDIISVFKSESVAWSNGKELDDDITFVIIKVK